jgi:hypothetical protein
MKYIFLSLLILLIASPVIAGGSKVFTNEDLGTYTTGNEESVYQYNQSVMQKQRQEQDNNYQQRGQGRLMNDLQRGQEATNQKYQSNMNRIGELEQEAAQDKLNAAKDSSKGKGFVAKRNREQTQERAMQREMELDSVYRDVGMGQERAKQRDEQNQKAEVEKAEKRAKQAEIRANQKISESQRPKEYYDTKSNKWVTCSGGFCY